MCVTGKWGGGEGGYARSVCDRQGTCLRGGSGGGGMQGAYVIGRVGVWGVAWGGGMQGVYVIGKVCVWGWQLGWGGGCARSVCDSVRGWGVVGGGYAGSVCDRQGMCMGGGGGMQGAYVIGRVCVWGGNWGGVCREHM